MSGTVTPPTAGLNWARKSEMLQGVCFLLFMGLLIKHFMPIHKVFWCFHKKLHIWHFWKNMLIFQVFHFFIQDNRILVWVFWLSPSLPSPPHQNIKTAFTSNLSNNFIVQKYWFCHPTDLLQWVPLCSVGLQLLGGAWVRTDQNLKAFREVLGHTETWITSVAHVDAKNWLCFPDENFQVDLDTCFCSGRQIIWIYVFTLICISAEICLRDLLNSKWA